jgi:hypothetical protein
LFERINQLEALKNKKPERSPGFSLWFKIFESTEKAGHSATIEIFLSDWAKAYVCLS